jgi:phenylacetate-CoA ligase
MTARHPAPGELDPIETASRDEITALQLTRLRATLQRAYDNVPHYRRAFDAKGVHPNDLKSLARPVEVPVHGEERPARQLPLRHVRRAA